MNPAKTNVSHESHRSVSLAKATACGTAFLFLACGLELASAGGAGAAGGAPGAGGARRGGAGGAGGARGGGTPVTQPSGLQALTAEHDGDFITGPDYTPAPEMTVKEGVPRGRVQNFTMSSADSKYYPAFNPAGGGRAGAAGSPYTRQGIIYIPAGYVEGTPAPFIIVHDGPGYRNSLVPTLDNMIADKRLPSMIAIMLNHGGGDSKGSERGLEYDSVSGKFAEFVQYEVLPKLEKDFHVKFTDDPDGRATMGGSSGAAAAFTMAWFHPEWYHRVISFSGTFVNQQSDANGFTSETDRILIGATPHGAWEYHEHLIPARDPKPLRVWIQVSENDNSATAPESGFHNWVSANVHMHDVLKAKEYHYQYVFSLNAGHTDPKVRSRVLPEAMEWAWKGYAAK